jgi:hypothetical protein
MLVRCSLLPALAAAITALHRHLHAHIGIIRVGARHLQQCDCQRWLAMFPSWLDCPALRCSPARAMTATHDTLLAHPLTPAS